MGLIRAMVTVAGNPVSSTPTGKCRQALAGLDFMVSIDIYINETTRYADVIFPLAVLLGFDHYDLISQTFAVSNTANDQQGRSAAGMGLDRTVSIGQIVGAGQSHRRASEGEA